MYTQNESLRASIFIIVKWIQQKLTLKYITKYNDLFHASIHVHINKLNASLQKH